jgi:hypothetical protein
LLWADPWWASDADTGHEAAKHPRHP